MTDNDLEDLRAIESNYQRRVELEALREPIALREALLIVLDELERAEEHIRIAARKRP